MKTYLFLAIKFLRGQSKIISTPALMSLFAIALGVAIVTTMMAFMDGYGKSIQTLFLKVDPHLTIYLENKKDSQNLENNIQTSDLFKEIDAISRVIESKAKINWESRGAIEELDVRIIAGRYSEQGFPVIQLPKYLKSNYFQQLNSNVKNKQAIVSKSLEKVVVDNQITFNNSTFTVIGYFEYDLGNLIFIQQSAMNEMKDINVLEALYINVKKSLELKIFKEKLKKLLNNSPEHKYIGILTWEEKYAGIKKMLGKYRLISFLGVIVIILISTFNIRTIIKMTVLQKQKQIALLKAIGSTSNNIKTVFLLLSSIIALIGTSLGVVLGQITAVWINTYMTEFIRQTSDLKVIVEINITTLIFIVVTVILFSLLNTRNIAATAAKTSPVDGFKG